MQRSVARRGVARPDVVGLGEAWLGMIRLARQSRFGKSRSGLAGLGGVRFGKDGRGMARLGVARAVSSATIREVSMPKKQFLSFIIDPSLLKRIDEFRFRFHFQSRAATIKWLLDWALKQNPKPSQDL
jgi:hypothetical protein